jgi:thiaminase
MVCLLISDWKARMMETGLAEAENSPACGVVETLVQSSTDVQRAIWRHPWVRAFADGTLPERALINWAGQCRLFCLMERQALLVLRAYTEPGALDDFLAKLVQDTVREPRELADLLVSLGAPVPDWPWRTCLGYGSFVQSSMQDGLLKGLTAILAVERIHLDTWTWFRVSCPLGSPYRRCVENWSSEAFRRVVGGLGDCLDKLAGPLFGELRGELESIYRNVALWELNFWEMSWGGERWREVEDQA